MPNKTIYISDSDMPIADRAADLAGGLSPAVTRALREFVERHDLVSEGFEEVHVADHSGGRSFTRVFSGRQLASLSESTNGRRVEWRSFITPKGNVAVVREERADAIGSVFDRVGLPGFGKSGGRKSGSDSARTKDAVSNVENAITDAVSSAFGPAFGGAVGGAFGSSVKGAMDDFSAKFGDRMRNHDRSTERWMGGKDSGRGKESGRGWGSGVVNHNDVRSHNESNRSRDDDNRSTEHADRANRGEHTELVQRSGEDSEARGHENDNNRANDRDHGNERDHRSDRSRGDDCGRGRGFSDPMQLFRNVTEDRPWASRDQSASLEVFADIEELKAAAFREPTESKPEIPTNFIAATEKALNTPPVEYLDI